MVPPNQKNDLQSGRPELYAGEITFVGNHLPRQCGIATFTTDLRNAAYQHYGGAVKMPVIAMNDQPEGYDYPDTVEWNINQSARQDYERAAEFVNRKNSRLICIQHEFGIFGGEDGNYILDFMSHVKVPIVVTLHTVLEKPSSGQRDVIAKMNPMVSRFVVMSSRAKTFLHENCGIPEQNIAMIHHGIPEFPPGNPQHFKSILNLPERTILLTFGLLSANKGIETVLKALPKVVKRFPDVAYVILGVTHPIVKKNEGESYRIFLRRMVRELQLEQHVFFHDQFVSLKQLTEYLQATDIYITPYLSKAQIVSGSLAYASGSGIPVLSTPYWYAEDLLSNGEGVLFPFSDSRRLETLLLDMLENPEQLKSIRRKALQQGRQMAWPSVGRQYVELFQDVLSEDRRRKPSPKKLIVPTELPQVSLRHIQRLTDQTGILQHATGIIPNREEGYCLDDNSRALMMAVQNFRIASDEESFELATVYLSYVQHSQRDDGSFHNFMNYQREFVKDGDKDADSEDSQARAIWALGYTVGNCWDTSLQFVAGALFHRSKHLANRMGVRGTSFSILGLCEYLEEHPDDREVRRLLERASDKLVECHKRTAAADWEWFEDRLTYANGILPLALFRAYRFTQDRKYLSVAKRTLSFLEKVCFEEDHLQLVGNQEWRSRSEKGCLFDEQPIDAMALVLLFREAYLILNERRHLERMRESFDWFLGKNRLKKPLYDFESKGCRDGLMEKDVNFNQGAESSLAFLISLLAVMGVPYVDPSKPGEE
ncbi:MAG: glycosyltransferase family 4 protein [Planctomycetota bacterium]|jgi:glycosyltransferase involved in cell wall biosynthesis